MLARPPAQLAEALARLRWQLPALIAAVGLAYAVGDHVFLARYESIWPHLLLGAFVLGLIGPVFAWRTLTVAAAMPRPLREQYTYWLAVVVGVGSIALVYYLMRSRVGLGLTAIRDSESAAMSLGVKITRIKLLVFIVSAFATGVVGGLIYLNALRITPAAAFSVQWSAYMAFIVVIGGLGTVEGPFLGAVVFFIFRDYLSSFGPWSMISFGAIAIIMTLVAPEGLWGILQRRFGFEIFPVRRRLPPQQ